MVQFPFLRVVFTNRFLFFCFLLSLFFLFYFLFSSFFPLTSGQSGDAVGEAIPTQW
jgi:hypothetical protein